MSLAARCALATACAVLSISLVTAVPATASEPHFAVVPGLRVTDSYGTGGGPVTMVCSSATSCSAAGRGSIFEPGSSLASGTLTMSEVAGHWRRASVSDFDGGFSSESCPAPGDCMAVGTYDSNPVAEGPDLAIAEPERSGSWSLPVTIGAASFDREGTDLNAVSCTAVGTCLAVGAYLDDGWQAMVAVDSHGTWQPPLAAALSVPGAVTSYFSAVACPAAGTCVLVGQATTGAGVTEPIVADESGGVLGPAVPLAVDLVYDGAQLDAVSCSSAGNCAAIGSVSYQAPDDGPSESSSLLATQVNGHWGAAQLLPGLSASEEESADVASIGCEPGGACVAVGGYGSGPSRTVTFETTEISGRWSRPAALPKTGSLANAQVADLSCSATASALIGTYSRGESTDLFTVSTSRQRWTTETTIPFTSTKGPESATPLGFGCPRSGACTAFISLQDADNDVAYESFEVPA